MSKVFSKMIHKFDRIDQLIRLKATGQPHELARKLRVSPSTIYEYIDVMKNVLSAPIKYCHIRRSYIYDEEGKLYLGFRKSYLANKF